VRRNEQNDSAVNDHTAAGQRKPLVELGLLALLFLLIAAVTVGVAWQIRRIRSSDNSKHGLTASRASDIPTVLFRQSQSGEGAVSPAPSLGDTPAYVPEFTLVDQDTNPVTLADLKGHVWVANFFFTSCPVQCPMMNTKLAQIHRALPDGAPAKLISITVDPDKDSPEVLAEYAKAFRAKDDRWRFLTGDKQAIIRLARDGFKLPATDDPNVHSLRLVLVDRDARIRGYFDSTDDKSIANLKNELKELLVE
jgi:protein SCO1/2